MSINLILYGFMEGIFVHVFVELLSGFWSISESRQPKFNKFHRKTIFFCLRTSNIRKWDAELDVMEFMGFRKRVTSRKKGLSVKFKLWGRSKHVLRNFNDFYLKIEILRINFWSLKQFYGKRAFFNIKFYITKRSGAYIYL